jgi:hypothetical protein
VSDPEASGHDLVAQERERPLGADAGRGEWLVQLRQPG